MERCGQGSRKKETKKKKVKSVTAEEIRRVRKETFLALVWRM
jgi:hypothetical protein